MNEEWKTELPEREVLVLSSDDFKAFVEMQHLVNI